MRLLIWAGLLQLVTLGTYVAIGTAWTDLRAYFEMTDIQFFTAWPFAALTLSLMITVILVTLLGITFNRYKMGVWIVHTGIVVLCIGAFIYFKFKTEGMAWIFLNETVSEYYHVDERALYIRSAGREFLQPIPKLPRFHEYDESLFQNGLALGVDSPLPQVTMKVVGYYPYAQIEAGWRESNAPTDPLALKLLLSSADDKMAPLWVLPKSKGRDTVSLGPQFTLIGRSVSDEELQRVVAHVDSGGIAHRLHVKVIEPPLEQTIDVKVGQNYPIAGTDYLLFIANYNPDWRMAGGPNAGEIDKVLQVQINSPGRELIRGVLAKHSDLTGDVEFVGGERVRPGGLIDKNIVITYTPNDPFSLHGNGVRITLVHADSDDSLHCFIAQNGEVEQPSLESDRSFGIDFPHGQLQATAEVIKHAARVQSIHIVPPAQRRRNIAESMTAQVVRIALTKGDWHRSVLVPYVQFAHLPQPGFEPIRVVIPELGEVQLQLSRTRLPLPVDIKLTKFELQTYPGGKIPKDYISTIRLTDRESGQMRTLTTRLNRPARHAGLLLFQNSWDPENQAFTVLGVGNQPGLKTMTLGCAMIVLGILYAFYLKPILLRAAKRRLAAEAAALPQNRTKPRTPSPLPAQANPEEYRERDVKDLA